MIRIVYLNGPEKGRRLVVREGSVEIGASAACEVTLPGDYAAAAKHAVLSLTAQGAHIRARSPDRPVTIGETTVTEADLRHNDTLTVGGTRLLIQVVSVSETRGRRRAGFAQVAMWVSVILVLIGEMIFLVVLMLVPGSDRRAVGPSVGGASVAAEAVSVWDEMEARIAGDARPADGAPVNDLERIQAELSALKAEAEALEDAIPAAPEAVDRAAHMPEEQDQPTPEGVSTVELVAVETRDPEHKMEAGWSFDFFVSEQPVVENGYGEWLLVHIGLLNDGPVRSACSNRVVRLSFPTNLVGRDNLILPLEEWVFPPDATGRMHWTAAFYGDSNALASIRLDAELYGNGQRLSRRQWPPFGPPAPPRDREAGPSSDGP